jgi:EmrB/QacA subfamily drug resistance transporter
VQTSTALSSLLHSLRLGLRVLIARRRRSEESNPLFAGGQGQSAPARCHSLKMGSSMGTPANALVAGQPVTSPAATALPLGKRASKRWAVLAVVTVGTFMTTLDASIVNIGLPSIAQAFGTPLTGAVEWVIIGYLVVIAALLLSVGRLADLIGRTPIWLAGLTLFTIGSAICGAAPALAFLIGARAFQGVGSALILATGLAILSDTFAASERGRALGINAIALALGASAGPTLGGVITQHLDWRWIFYVNVPVGVAAVIASHRVLPPAGQRVKGHFDFVGAILLGLGIAALNLGLSFGQEWGWTSLRFLGTLLIAIGALLGAVLYERRAPTPLLDLSLFRNRVFSSSLVSLVLSMLSLFAIGFLLPFYFEELRGFSTERAGLLLTPFSLTLAVVGPIAGSMADRFGSRWLAPLGLAIMTLGLVQLARLEPNSSIGEIVVPLVVSGLGQGLFLSPNSNALLGATPRAEQGQASGILATGRIVGQSLSVALAGAVFASLGGASAGMTLISFRTSLTDDQIAATQATFIDALHTAFLVCAAFAAVGVLTALVRGKDQPTPDAVGAERPQISVE